MKGVNQRTGHELALFATKADHNSYAVPSFYITDQTHGYLQTTFQMTPSEFVHGMEAWNANGGARGMFTP